MEGKFLITGGAGYVGSHLVAELVERGAKCVVFDDLSTGHAQAVPRQAELVRGDLADGAAIGQVMSRGPWDAVFHFAAISIVGDSMREPFRYLRENVGNGLRLIEACVQHGVKRFVLSSTAALFGTPREVPIGEDTPVDPGSPYAESKFALERALLWADRIHGLRSASLRYFNAAGCDPRGRLGEDHRPETHLIPLVVDAAMGRRPEIVVFGQDYPTPDGSCIRDYVHVTDLADCHIRVLERIDRGSVSYNIGSGAGYSVFEVIRAVERISGRKFPVRIADRRPGDPAVLVASSTRIMKETGWNPRWSSLDQIVETTLSWRRSHPEGFAD